MAHRNQYLIGEGVRPALEKFKYEVARELGITDYANTDKGNLTSRVNGSIGGEMVKRMVSIAEQSLAGGNMAYVAQSSAGSQQTLLH